MNSVATFMRKSMDSAGDTKSSAHSTYNPFLKEGEVSLDHQDN